MILSGARGHAGSDVMEQALDEHPQPGRRVRGGRARHRAVGRHDRGADPRPDERHDRGASARPSTAWSTPTTRTTAAPTTRPKRRRRSTSCRSPPGRGSLRRRRGRHQLECFASERRPRVPGHSPCAQRPRSSVGLAQRQTPTASPSPTRTRRFCLTDPTGTQYGMLPHEEGSAGRGPQGPEGRGDAGHVLRHRRRTPSRRPRRRRRPTPDPSVRRPPSPSASASPSATPVPERRSPSSI